MFADWCNDEAFWPGWIFTWGKGFHHYFLFVFAFSFSDQVMMVFLLSGCVTTFFLFIISQIFLPIMFSSIRSVCFCQCFLRSGHLWTNLPKHSPLFQPSSSTLFFFFFFPFLIFLSLPNFFCLSLSLYLGFPGLCSVPNLYDICDKLVLES